MPDSVALDALHTRIHDHVRNVLGWFVSLNSHPRVDILRGVYVGWQAGDNGCVLQLWTVRKRARTHAQLRGEDRQSTRRQGRTVIKARATKLHHLSRHSNNAVQPFTSRKGAVVNKGGIGIQRYVCHSPRKDRFGAIRAPQRREGCAMMEGIAGGARYGWSEGHLRESLAAVEGFVTDEYEGWEVGEGGEGSAGGKGAQMNGAECGEVGEGGERRALRERQGVDGVECGEVVDLRK